MKRLLSYLFLVLGLGLVFSVNANSDEIFYVKKLDGWISKGNFEGIMKNSSQIRGISKIERNNNAGLSIWVGTYYLYTAGHSFHKGYWKHIYNDDGEPLASYIEYKKNGETLSSKIISISDFNKALDYIKLDLNLPFDFNKKYLPETTQIAKKEPIQTQQVAKKEGWGNDWMPTIVLQNAIIYLRNGERIEGDVFEIGPIDQYIVVRTKRENRKRIRYDDIDYILHNNDELADFLQTAAKEPEPEPEQAKWGESKEEELVIEKARVYKKFNKQQFRSRDLFDNIIASSAYKKSRESGLYLYLSNPNFQFRSSEFKRVIDKGIIEKRFGIGLGIEYRMAQHLFGVLASTVNWDHSFGGVIDSSSITFFGSDLYYAYSLFNIRSITPSVGFGYQSSSIGKYVNSETISLLNTSGYYFFGEIKAGFTRKNSYPIWKSLGKNNGAGIGLQYKLSIALEERQWSQTNVYFYLFGEWALYPPCCLLLILVAAG